ncbi:MAG: putative LPS assembly protein LptD [Balneolaceae bacterium]
MHRRETPYHAIRLRLLATLTLLFVTATPAWSQQGAASQVPGARGGAGSGSTVSPTEDDGRVRFQAADSLIFQSGETREATLFGSARVSKGENQLTAGEVALDLNRNEVRALSDSSSDSLSYPTLMQGSNEIRSSRILFNYETERGKFNAAEVQIQDGYLTGDQIKNVSRQEVFIDQGRYSTCPPTHMYYYIEADRMKVVEEDEIFFTNARLYLLDIPYPVLFPFGYIPSGLGPDQKESGFLEPTYAFQNVSDRGIGLQNLGWFQYINDYLTAQTSFDIFTSGTFFNESRAQYRRTGFYNGSVTLGYSSERGLEPTDPGYTRAVNKRVTVTHNQDLSPYASLSANINLRTADYFQRTSYDIDERAQTSSSSNLSYRYRHPDNLFTFNVSNRLNQQFSNNSARLSGPQMNFSLQQFTPFEPSTPRMGGPRWYETLSIRYSNQFESDYNYRPVNGADESIGWFDALLDPALYREATGEDRHIDLGMRHQVQLSANNLIPSQFMNTSAGFSMNEYWYPTSTRKEWDPDTGTVLERTEQGFVAGRDFSTSINFSTTIYGISQLAIGSLEGFRHTLRPNVGFSYRPDFSDPSWGFYRDVQRDSTGRTERYSIFEDEVYGGPGRGEQMSMNFGISNIFETKQVRRDSTGEINSETLRLIDNLSVNSSYNFAADSLNFSNINASLSTRVVEGVNLSASATYSLYARGSNGQIVDRYIWQETGKILQPLNYSLSANYSIQGGPNGSRPVNTPAYTPYDPLDQHFFGPVDTRFNRMPLQYYQSPWAASFSLSYRWNWVHEQKARQSATLNVNNIRFNLTPKWDVSTRFGFDFMDQELTPSQFSLTRRMVCWTLSFQFNPFGEFQYYFFRLSIDSGQIQSLFQKLPLLNNLERSSSPTGRSPRF